MAHKLRDERVEPCAQRLDRGSVEILPISLDGVIEFLTKFFDLSSELSERCVCHLMFLFSCLFPCFSLCLSLCLPSACQSACFSACSPICCLFPYLLLCLALSSPPLTIPVDIYLSTSRL